MKRNTKIICGTIIFLSIGYLVFLFITMSLVYSWLKNPTVELGFEQTHHPDSLLTWNSKEERKSFPELYSKSNKPLE